MSLRSPDSSSALWPLVAIDLVSVGAVIALHAMLGDKVSPAIHVTELLLVGAAGAGCAYLWWRNTNRPAAAADTAAAEVESLRKETAENLRVIQDDLHKLGEALMKRLAQKPDAKPEADQIESLAGTMTDLAVSIAEARETLSAIAADLAETKSSVFELQTQADQQADALRAFEHTVEKTQHFSDADPGSGPARGALEKALAAGVAGAAVSRLINGNNASAKDPEATGPAAPAAAVPPLSEEDIEGSFETDDDFDGDNLPEEDWGEATLPETGLASPAGSAVEPLTTSPEEAEAELTDGEEDDNDDWLSAGLDEDDSQDDMPAPAAQTRQPDLLALDDEAESKKKPRRPGKHDTALVAHVMIGIGNKPFLRGFGPGLSTSKGVPMEYVDVGRWQWVCPEAGSPVTVTLWKNDETPADGAPISVPSGMTLEIHPHFAQ